MDSRFASSASSLFNSNASVLHLLLTLTTGIVSSTLALAPFHIMTETRAWTLAVLAWFVCGFAQLDGAVQLDNHVGCFSSRAARSASIGTSWCRKARKAREPVLLCDSICVGCWHFHHTFLNLTPASIDGRSCSVLQGLVVFLCTAIYDWIVTRKLAPHLVGKVAICLTASPTVRMHVWFFSTLWALFHSVSDCATFCFDAHSISFVCLACSARRCNCAPTRIACAWTRTC